MIPKKIQIKNFLSYGSEPQTIDFLNYNLICLSGKNGHGKSALLDAITWAVWGQARKTTGTSKADEGLVHLGQKHMLVIFDFEINGQNYRIRREFIKTQSNPFSALDFGIVKEDESFTTLTDKTIKATQTKLEKTIGISYESFINSAFLRQGQANEFSKKSAKERKEILATILQLERFEDLKKIAVEKGKTLQLHVIQKQSLQDRITNEISELEAALQDIATSLEKLSSVEQQEKDYLQLLVHDETTKDQLQEQHKKYEFIQLQIAQYSKQRNEIESQIVQYKKTYDFIASKQIDITNIKVIEDQQKQLRDVISLHQEKLNKRLELKDQYLNLQEEKQKVETELSQEKLEFIQKHEISNKVLVDQIQQTQQLLQLHEKKYTELTTEIANEQIKITAHENAITKQQGIIEKLATYEKAFEEHKNKFQALKAQGIVVDQQISDLHIKNKFSLENQDPSCPVCEQNLSASRKKFLEQKFIKEQIDAKELLENIKLQAVQLQKQLVDEHAQLAVYKKENEDLTKLILQTDAMKSQITKNIAQLNSQEEQIVNTSKLIENLQKNLIADQVAQKKAETICLNPDKERLYETLIKKIDVLKQTAQKLAYDKEAHEKDYKLLQEADIQLASYQKLQTELAEQEQRLSQIQALQEQYTKITSLIDLCTNDFQAIHQVPELLTQHIQIMLAHKQSLQAITHEKSALLQKKTIADLQTTKLLSLQKEHGNLDSEIKLLHAEVIDFAEIVKALGKDGLQALLIEEALPEIEQEANILLAQLTDNQTQIYIESLRDLKKGGSKETLDIKISDAIGLRPYEMFSGGEAFRIDFALRIAISKLLARRAGTSLQTLIIDEGFGSQDDEGLQLIMDSILKIQSNFAMVIIVSHLPSMKEQFPVQFLVEKKASGSVVTVIEQG